MTEQIIRKFKCIKANNNFQVGDVIVADDIINGYIEHRGHCYNAENFIAVFEKNPRRFRAKEDVFYDTGHYANINAGEILTLFTMKDRAICFTEKISSSGHYWEYIFFTAFEEIFEDEIVDHPPVQSLLATKVSIDDLAKLRSAFSLDEIIVMIEKGIV